ncbi:restriction endonuclease subunit S [Sulfuricurvum sp.]|uniref:restriction endonuclease subunit S n=1 Tax=Sulfuricurvum sp. TaxID=2025608 RepID=UPI00286E4370|nr:restriction endonuclease subunit S [Sulfuricurvum sp.]
MLKKLGDVLQLDKRNKIDIKDDGEYCIAGVQSYGKGVVIRRSVVGKELTMKQYQVIKKDQLMWCKVDTKNGAFGLTKEEHIGSLASTNMALANIDTSKILPNFLETLFQVSSFHEHITKYSSGSTNRKYLTPQQLFELIEIPDFSLEEQKKFIQRVESIRKSGLAEEIEIQLNLVSKLRQAILQEAIEGKLTAQWRKEIPDVEPVSKLLEKIRAEKERLIKKEKPLPKVNEDEIPFDVPDNWEWIRLGDIGETNIGLTYSPLDISDDGLPVLRSNNIKNGQINYHDLVYVKTKVNEKKMLNKGDILICARNGSKHLVGKSALIMEDGMSFGAFMTTFRSPFYNYVYLFLQSNIFRNQFDDEKSTGINQLTQEVLRNIILPFPSENEQSNIVQRVNSLFDICDELEQQIKDSKANTEMLMQAVLKEAFEEKSEPQAPKTFQRSVLAAYLIDNSQDDLFFGHVKLQKMLFMCEAVNNLDFDTDYKRHAMGPYDPKLIRSVDSQLKKAKWFEVKKLEGEISRYVYHPLEKVEEYKKYVGRYWDHKKIEHIFQLMKPMRTLQAEIVATLFSANSDLKKTNISITDAILINEARNNWHDNKKNIAVETWEKAIEWMKSKNLL